MAIGTAGAQQLLGGAERRDVIAGIERARVKCIGVASLAHKRLPDRKHAGLVAAVGIVTGRAIFAYRLMLPQERPALLGVAGGAGSDHVGLRHQGATIGAMGVVTTGAVHQAFHHRVMAAAIELALFFLVTVEAQSGVRFRQ